MQIGIIGLENTGAAMTWRLLAGERRSVVVDKSAEAVHELSAEKVVGASPSRLADLATPRETPRTTWILISGAFVDKLIVDLLPRLVAGEILIDGGNSYRMDDVRGAKELEDKTVH